MKPHEIHLNGVDGFVMDVKDRGQRIRVSGWNQKHWEYEKGNLVILHLDGENRSTRYRITDVTHSGDPPDQYFLTLEFVPRKEKVAS